MLAGCGSSTLGPLITNGLDARRDLQRYVDQRRRHGTPDTQPLDALVDIDATYRRMFGATATTQFVSNVEGWIVTAEGMDRNPMLLVNEEPLVAMAGDGAAVRFMIFPNKQLAVSVTWPDTTMIITDSILTEAEMGVDTAAVVVDWSKATRAPIPIGGTRADSLYVSIAVFTDGSFSVLDTSFVCADTGSITLPTRIADSARVGDQILVYINRSYYRMHHLNTPRSGYGNRIVGILQRCRLANRVYIVP